MHVEDARQLALSMANVEEYDHFGKPAYRLAPKHAGGKPGRTLMTLWLDEGHAVLMLDVDLQTEVIASNSEAFRPHPTKWGAKGATIAEFSKLSLKAFERALRVAHTHAQR
ncbi:MAG: hypothetical protein IPH05_09690 [Flavobacteriales bacterium]|jgi:hypothetical protein|nr:hypothetical protein [Flavobacteriales bacterium]MBK6552160.1 hypothetical protein [Flavobacteriales bacterium]MBK6883197.1 hypothetical protein [Flavobacteriales bacterium]MBK7103236.1 hypothetical protein [Flavobacteriales bacterium]MBK7112792.1 hypothetical protein [Flavobacteriales bacterium]